MNIWEYLGVGIFVALISALLFHKLAKRRTNTDEFNELATPVRIKIDESLKYIHNDKHTGPWIEPGEVEALHEIWGGWCFGYDLWLYNKRINKYTGWVKGGTYEIHNPLKIEKSLKSIRKHIQRK